LPAGRFCSRAQEFQELAGICGSAEYAKRFCLIAKLLGWLPSPLVAERSPRTPSSSGEEQRRDNDHVPHAQQRLRDLRLVSRSRKLIGRRTVAM
jgi:hypothetical protein